MHINTTLSTSNKLSPRGGSKLSNLNKISNKRSGNLYYGHGASAIESKTKLLARNEDSIYSEADMDSMPGIRLNSRSHLQKNIDWQKKSQRALAHNTSLVPDASTSFDPHLSHI